MKTGISAYSVANTIRLIRTQWKGSVVISEGDSDARIFKRFLDPASCRLEVAHGKDNALGALGLLKHDKVSGVFSLVDKDTILLDPRLALNPDVLVTDTHDLETMMLQSPALEKVLTEFGSESKIQTQADDSGKSIRDTLSEAALPVGLLRLASNRNGLNLKFDGCDFGAFVDRDTLYVNIANLATEIINNTRNHKLQSPFLQEMIEKEKEHGLDKWDVCCGHDLTALLSIGLRKLFGSCNAIDVSVVSLERSLRLAYEESFFKMTDLFRSLKKWEERNTPFIVLS